ncbi:peptidylprolyl isomerase [Nocardioidaceae bacterium]|nr:peptidylprolyl isomerase [Nocardioidaceae bacterium]
MRTTASLLATLGLLFVTGCSGTVQDASAPADSQSATSSAGEPSASATPSGPCTYTETGAAAVEVDLPSGEEATGNPRVTLSTNQGDVPVDLDTDLAPCTVASFLSLAEQGYYDDTPCHRLTTANAGIFVLQCGDPTGSGSGGPGYQFDDEVDQLTDELQCSGNACIYPTGTVAMANAGPGTNGSQFFLVYEDSPLPPAYTVFGQMSPAGLEVVQEIAAAGTVEGASPDDGPPAQETIIESVSEPAA